MGIILLYHRIAIEPCDPYSLCITPTQFRRQMQFVRNRFETVELDELVSRRDGQHPSVAITFDDGYTDNLHEASPILAELGIPATFFVTTAGLDESQPYWWDVLARSSRARDTALHAEFVQADPARRHDLLARLDGSHDVNRMPRPMSATEIESLAAMPGHRVGAHTTHHLCLPAQSHEVCLNELRESKLRLEELLDDRVASIAYPYGACNEDVAQLARSAGFEIGVGIEHGLVDSHKDLMRLPRIEVSPATDLEAVLQQLFDQPR